MNLNEGTRGAFPPSPRTPFFDGNKTPHWTSHFAILPFEAKTGEDM